MVVVFSGVVVMSLLTQEPFLQAHEFLSGHWLGNISAQSFRDSQYGLFVVVQMSVIISGVVVSTVEEYPVAVVSNGSVVSIGTVVVGSSLDVGMEGYPPVPLSSSSSSFPSQKTSVGSTLLQYCVIVLS